MRSAACLCVSFASLLLLGGAVPAESQVSRNLSPREAALKAEARPGPELQHEIARRLAQVVPVHMVAPLWQLGASTTTDLYVINTFSEPIDLGVSALDPKGRELASTVLTVEPARHRVLPIASLVGSSPVGVSSQGSLRLDYVGDKDMLQAWVVRRDAGGVTEVPLKKVSADTERQLTSFWDLRRSSPRGRQDVQFWLVNGGTETLPFRIETTGPERLGRVVYSGVLQPGEQRAWEPRGAGVSAAHGVVNFVHDGTPGALAVAGFVQGRGVLATLPIATPEMRLLSPRYDAVRVPFFHELLLGLGEGVVTLANTADRAQNVAVQIFATGVMAGTLLGEAEVEVRPGEARSVELGNVLRPQEALSSETARVTVRGELPGLLVEGLSRSYLTGETIELSFFPREKVHPNGSYPVPDPKRFRVSTRLVNLSEEDSRIVGQVSWNGGTYSVGPVVIPPGSSHEVDFRQMAALGEEDIAKRTLPASFSGGFFHWTVQGGGTEIIARTEVAPDGGLDTFGFNCFGCCFESSKGAVLPSSTTFATGSSAPFEGVEFIDSCSGTMGPYTPVGAAWSYASPFTWNGTTVSASAPDSQSLSFSAMGHRTTLQLPCSEIPITIFGAGPATATKVTVLGVSLPNNQVQIRLEPAGMSGTLEVKLTGPSQRVLVNTTYASGDHTIGFGNLASYSAGQEFTQVRATWTVNGKAASGTSNYHFKALGSYNHTRYNVPVSNQCTGSLVNFCYFTGDCINVASCTVHQTAQAPSSWITEIEENGSGYHTVLGFVTGESFCSHPGACAHTFRKVTNPCPSCNGLPLTPGATVAINRFNPNLSCGDQVFVDTIGVVRVTDYGGGLTNTQLDHYIGTSGCNQASTIGSRATFLLQ